MMLKKFHPIPWGLRARGPFWEKFGALTLLIGILITQTGSKEAEVTPIVTSDDGQVGVEQVVSGKYGQWIPYSSDSGTPPAGEDCAMIYDPPRQRIILYGGKNDQNENLNQTWWLDLATKHWNRLNSIGPNPPPLEDHTVIFDPLGDQMILYGGEANKGTEGGTWALDLKTMIWSDITVPNSPRKEDHTAIYDSKRKRMISYGGREDNQVNLTTIHSLDLNPESPTLYQWTQEKLKENKKKIDPPGRIDHVAIYDPKRDRMVIFGGWDKIDNVFLNDTWAFDFKEMTWRGFAKKRKSEKPPGRRHAIAVYDDVNDWMIVFGGAGGGLFNDVWAFDLEQNEWINLTPGPKPRTDHVAIFDKEKRRVLIYGGETVSGGPKLHDLWEFSLQ